MKSSEIKRKLEVGDVIVKGGTKQVIGEILSQDCYKDEDAAKYGLEDRSYIEVEFKDTKGAYHSWKSSVDGGSVIYKSSNCKGKFRDMLFKQGKTVGEINDVLVKEGYKKSEIYQCMVDVLGDMCFRD